MELLHKASFHAVVPALVFLEWVLFYAQKELHIV